MTSNLLRLGSNLILTRLLFPEAFGLMALVQTFITGLNLFSDTGIRSSIIQNDKGTEPEFLNTAWTLQIVRGLILWVISVAIAGPVARFYEEPMLAMVLPVVALNTIVQGFMPVRIHTANRELLLGRITILSLIGQASSIALMMVFAVIWQSVWALVFGGLIGSVIQLVATHLYMPGHRERLQIDRSSLYELVSFGKWIFISTACVFLVNHADRAILGKWISLELLGIYTVGFFLANVPTLIGVPMTGKIVFPLYKQRPPSESRENRRKIFRMRRMLTGGLLGILGFLALTGNYVIDFLYDDRYALAGPILVMLAMANMPRIILLTYPGLSLSAGDSKRFMYFLAASAFAQTLALYFGISNLGIFGAAIAPAIANIVVYPLAVKFARDRSGWDWRHDLGYYCLAVVLCAAAIWVNHEAIMVLWHAS